MKKFLYKIIQNQDKEIKLIEMYDKDRKTDGVFNIFFIYFTLFTIIIENSEHGYGNQLTNMNYLIFYYFEKKN